MAKRTEPISYNDDAHMGQLFALMPNGTLLQHPPETFDPDAQLTVNDFNSFEAARVTLEKFGAGVKAYTWSWSQLYCEFSDGDEGGKTVVFYNNLPRNMAKYKPKA